MSKPEISIIIPLFNEEKRLPALFESLEVLIEDQHYPELEVVFVNDGSTDKTMILVEKFVERHLKYVKVISYSENKGKGFAVRVGMLEAKHDRRIFLDADLSVSLDQIEKFDLYMKNGPVVIIGSRNLKISNILVYQPVIRQNLGKFYNLISRIITGVNVTDFTCGFKCFSKEAVQIIFPKTKIDRWSFDSEVLFLAKRYNISIVEVGITWQNNEDTKVSLFKDILQSFVDLLRIRIIHWFILIK